MNKKIKKLVVFFVLLMSLLTATYSININLTSPNSDYDVHIYNINENSENILLSLNNTENSRNKNLDLTGLTTSNMLIFEPEEEFVFGSFSFNGNDGYETLPFKKYNESLTAAYYQCNPKYVNNNGDLSNFEVEINSNLIAPTTAKNGNPNFGDVDFSAVPEFEAILNNSYYAKTNVNIRIQDNITYEIEEVSKEILLKDRTSTYNLEDLSINENDRLIDISIDVIDGKCGVKTIDTESISEPLSEPSVYSPNSINISTFSLISDYKTHIYNINENSENILLSLNESGKRFVSSLDLNGLTTNNALIFEPEEDFVFASFSFNGYSSNEVIDFPFKKYNESATAANYKCDPSRISVENNSLSNLELSFNSNLIAPTIAVNGNSDFGYVNFSAVPEFEDILNSNYYADANVKIEFKNNETNKTKSISEDILLKNGTLLHNLEKKNIDEDYEAQNITIDVTDLKCGVKRIVYYDILTGEETYSNYTNVEVETKCTTCGSSSGGSSGSSSKSMEQYLTSIKEKLSFNLKKKTTLKLNIENDNKVYELVFTKLNKDDSLKIKENGNTKEVQIGYENNLDVDNDGNNDYKIIIKSLVDKNNIEIEILNLGFTKEVVEITTPEVVEKEEETPKDQTNETDLIGGNVVKTSSFSWMWAFVIVILISIGLIFAKYYQNNNNNDKKKKLLIDDNLKDVKDKTNKKSIKFTSKKKKKSNK